MVTYTRIPQAQHVDNMNQPIDLDQHLHTYDTKATQAISYWFCPHNQKLVLSSRTHAPYPRHEIRCRTCTIGRAFQLPTTWQTCGNCTLFLGT